MEMQFWVVLGGFRQRTNGQKWGIWDVWALKARQKPEFWINFMLKHVYISVFSKKTLKQHCKNLCSGPTLCLNICKLRGFWRKTMTTYCKDYFCWTIFRYVYIVFLCLFSISWLVAWELKFHHLARTEPKNLWCGRPPHAKRGDYGEYIRLPYMTYRSWRAPSIVTLQKVYFGWQAWGIRSIAHFGVANGCRRFFWFLAVSGGGMLTFWWRSTWK